MTDYDDLIAQAQQTDTAQRARVGFVTAADTNPDAYAEARRVARRTGVPVDTALNLPAEMQRQARVGEIDFGTLAQTAPATAALLADVDRAKLAHDDVENMAGVERVARQFFGSAGETVGRSFHGIGELADVAQRRLLSGFASAFLPTPMAGGAPTVESLAGPQIGEDWRELGKTAMHYYRREVMIPPNRQTFADQVVGGLGQIGAQIAMLPIDRGATLWAQGASVMGERVENDNAPQLNKDLAILGGSAVTGITEKFALDKLLGPLAVPIKNRIAAALTRIGIAGAAEGGQEIAEGVGHDLLQMALTDPEHSINMGQSLAEGGVGATVGGIVRSVVEAALHVKTRGEYHARRAEQDAQALSTLAELSQASKLAKRDPQAFAHLVEQATEGTADVFISAQALAQSGRADQIAAVSPAVAEQLQDALDAGGDVRIPVGEFASRIAATGHAQDLIDHLKTDPGGMTRAEAQAFAQQQEQGIDADELARLAVEQHRDLTRAEEVRAIERQISEQLDATGRFSPSVNRAYAALPTAFFDTMAERLGVSPAELFNHYALQVVAEPVTGEALDQAQRGVFVPGSQTIALLKNADLSTFLHETGHFFLESYADMADAAPALQQDMQTVLDWFGVKDLAAWQGMSLEQRRTHHEAFARGFERYLHEGTAPSLKLQSLFARFRAWLARVYRDIRGLDVEISGEVRAVFDRMLATDAHIEEARRARAMTPLFGSESEASAYGIDWQQYQALGRESTDEALATLEARSLRDMTWTAKLREQTIKRLNRDAADKRKAVRREVEAEVAAQPVYRAWAYLTGRKKTSNIPNRTDSERAHLTPQEDYQLFLSDFGLTEEGVEAASNNQADQIPMPPGASKIERGKSSIEGDGMFAAENVSPGKVLAPARIDGKRTPAGRYTNHSNKPNAGYRAHPNGDLDLVAIEAITEGAEVVIDYRAAAEVNGWREALQKRADTLHGKLNTNALKDLFGDAADAQWRKLVRYQMTSETQGLSPDMVAELFGFPSGDAMVRELIEAPPMREAVEALTDVRMLERYGDLASPEAIARAADEAIHGDVRTRFLATELAGLQKAVGGAQALTRMAKDYAARMIGQAKATGLRPTQYAAAEVRAGKAAEAALRQGDTREAIRHKRHQLIQQAATRAAYEAQAEVEKTLATFRTIAAAKGEKTGKSRNMDIVNAARAILAEYGVGMRGKNPRAYMEAVKAYDPELYAVLEPALLDAEQTAKPIDDLSVAELRALRDHIESLWYLARRERLVEIDGKLVDRDQITTSLVERLEALGVPETVPGEGHAVTEGDKRVRYLMGARAALRRVEHWADRMDGGKITGAFRRFIFQPISEAADRYRADAGAYLKRYRDLLKAIEPTLKPGRIAAPELGYTFGFSKGDAGKAELLHAILHTGNASNKRKLLLGRGWATESAEGVLDTGRWDAFVSRMIAEGKLTKADFDFAQGVWDLLEETKPAAQKTHREVFGRYFDEVTADTFTNKFDTYRGGYVPAIYDTFEVQDAAIHSELDAINQGNAFMFPATARGFTKGRVEYNKPLALDLRLLPQHIDKVLLFAHLEPRVRDVMRTLRAKGFAGTLGRYDATAYTDLLLPWLNRAAKQTVETPATGWAGKLGDRFFRTMRSRSGMAAMFANLTNALQQITGLSITALKVKPKHLKAATWRYLRAPSEVAEQIAGLSTFMATRQTNEVMQMRQEIEALLLNPSAYEKAQAWTAKHAYFLQSAFQNVVDNISWLGAFDQATSEGLSEADAVRAANAAVRETQGSLQPEDISRFESGTAFTRLFTQFTGYFNMQANILGTEFAKVAQDAGLRKGAGRLWYVFLLGFLVPAWMSEAIVQGMRGGIDDEDDDGYLDEFLAFFFGAPARNAAAMVPIAGQSVVLVANSFNRKPYDDRMSTAPAISMIESAASAPHSIYKAIADGSSARRAIRDTLTLIAITTGIPVSALGKPLGYAADVAQDRVEPTGPLDAARGLISGAASSESKR